MSDKIDVSRNSILINKNINYKRKYKYESNNTCNIWLDIKIKGGKSLLLMGGYRQWSLLKQCNIPQSKSNKQQVSRFKTTLDNWGKAMGEDKDVIVATDDNIDSSNSNHNNKYSINNLRNMLSNHLNQYNLAQINFDHTRIVSHQQPSCIDHIYSNCMNKITSVRTVTNIDSDHKYIVCRYLTKEPQYKPKKFLKRDYSELNGHNINKCLDQSPYLNDIFTSNDSNFIAETIQLELNTIFNVLAPGKLVQYKNDYIPYMNEDIKEKIVNKTIKILL